MLKPPPLLLVSRESLIHTELFLSAGDSVHCVRDACTPSAGQYTRKVGLYKRGMHPALCYSIWYITEASGLVCNMSLLTSPVAVVITFEQSVVNK
jgi:hypothetical protein